jgi:hypothetical protein
VTDLPKLAKPAERAVLAAGLDSLEKLAARSDAELLALHGMGKNALRIIRAEQVKLPYPRDGDPTQDIRSLYDLRLVVLGGVVAHRSAALKPEADEYGGNE